MIKTEMNSLFTAPTKLREGDVFTISQASVILFTDGRGVSVHGGLGVSSVTLEGDPAGGKPPPPPPHTHTETRLILTSSGNYQSTRYASSGMHSCWKQISKWDFENLIHVKYNQSQRQLINKCGSIFSNERIKKTSRFIDEGRNFTAQCGLETAQ